MSIGERLREFLDIKGMSAAEFSRQTGLPYRSLQNYLRGERAPSSDAIAEICTRMGISANWLLLGHGPMNLGEGEGRKSSPSSSDHQPVSESKGTDSGSKGTDVFDEGIERACALLREEMLPACRSNDGVVVIADATTAKGEARHLAKTFLSQVNERWRDAIIDDTVEEKVSLILAIRVEDRGVS